MDSFFFCIVPVTNVTSCFYIDQCHLCGTDSPPRGICYPELGVSACKCYVNDDTSEPYAGERCLPQDKGPLRATYPATRWTPVIVGILAGVAGLFCTLTCCLWALALWRRRRRHDSNKYEVLLDVRVIFFSFYLIRDELPTSRLWNLPRAQMPTSGTAENIPRHVTNTTPTSSSNQTDSDRDRMNTADSEFFKELDQRMSENLRATIARPNTSGLLASLPLDEAPTLSVHDPIDELDAIIDNEDLNRTFHEPLTDLFEDNEVLEAINTNLKLPRPNLSSEPTGFLSV